MSLVTLGVLPLPALAAPTFGVYASVIVQLQAEVVALVQLSIQVGISPPELAVCLEALILLASQLAIALGLDLPDISATFALSFNAQLVVLLGIVAALNVALNVGGGEVQVITYAGITSSLGADVASLVAPGTCTALILGATSTVAAAALSGFFDGTPRTFSPGATIIGDLALSSLMSANFELLADLEGEFAGRASAMAKASAQVALIPPTIAGQITFLGKITVEVKAAIAIGMPSIGLSLLASIKARIAAIGALVAQVEAILAFATDGFDAFAYSGDGASLGGALSSALASGWPDGAPSNDNANALILVASTPSASAALGALFPPVLVA